MPKLLLLFISCTLSLFSISQTKEDLFIKASDYYIKNDYQNTLLYIEQALKQDSTNGDYLLLKGNVEMDLEKYREAFNTFSYGIYLYPNDAYFYNQRGILLNKFQRSEEAIRDFNKALELPNADSIESTLLLNRGASKADVRDFNGAYDDYKKALAIDSLNIALLNNMATICDEVGRGDETLQYLYKILEIDSTFIGAYGNIGFKLQQLGDYKTSTWFFNKVQELEPDEPLAYGNRAYNHYKLGKLDSALYDINKSIELYPANSYAYRTRSLIYIALNHKSKACLDIEKALLLGFTKKYGDEVEKLNIEYCVKTNKL